MYDYNRFSSVMAPTKGPAISIIHISVSCLSFLCTYV